jgi:hypothetical protein
VLAEIAEKLDAWAIDQDLRARDEGLPRLRPCTIRILGQSALLELKLPFTLAVTKDVDVQADYDDAVRREFARLLAAEGRDLDPLGHEIWMPRETRYAELFHGRFVAMLLADAEAVLLSKASKAPLKNKLLLTEYLASGASERFLQLAAKYRVDLEQFV